MSISTSALDAVTECINIGAGKAAAALNQLFHSHINLRVPQLFELDPGRVSSVISAESENPRTAVRMEFMGDVTGKAFLVLDSANVPLLLDALTGVDKSMAESSEFRISVILELGNIAINAIVGSISNMARAQVDYTVPCLIEPADESMMRRLSEGLILQAYVQFEFEKIKVPSVILLLFDRNDFADHILARLSD